MSLLAQAKGEETFQKTGHMKDRNCFRWLK
jgi:hypothetical protein